MAGTEFVLIRHAPVVSDGRVYGRRDLGADLSDTAALLRMAEAVGDPGVLRTSPARRCQETAKALWPALLADQDPALWEQSLGLWEGSDPASLPDLGPMSRLDLANHHPPSGESFSEMCHRTAPAFRPVKGVTRVTIVAHAGTVRAALAYALGHVPPALAFEVRPLSITRILILPDGQSVIHEVNRCP
ncbi:histidine phosphatase family protein [Rhodobacteraceae bacterium]|nr:histidine phosphatase family protein [Paracoccaceae bacterium]